MCKSFLHSILILICFTACKKQVSQLNTDNYSIQQIDTIFSTASTTYIDALKKEKDTLLTIEGYTYNLTCKAVMDTLKKVSYTVVATQGGKVNKMVYNGYDITYTISLSGSGGTKFFTKTFKKVDFEKQIGKDALGQSIIELPDFLGYHREFDAFMFSLRFMVPDSDVGDECFIMITRNGQVIDKSYNNSFGGGGSDGKIEISKDGKLVVTNSRILNTNGRKVEFNDGKVNLVHTKLINGSTILLVYDPQEGNKENNARLIDNYGKVLKTFNYSGYYDMLGYVVPSYFDKNTGTYIMLDDQLDNITVIPAGNPLGIFTVPFTTLRDAKTNPDHEVIFDINTETSEQTFAIDTVTKDIRLVRQQK